MTAKLFSLFYPFQSFTFGVQRGLFNCSHTSLSCTPAPYVRHLAACLSRTVSVSSWSWASRRPCVEPTTMSFCRFGDSINSFALHRHVMAEAVKRWQSWFLSSQLDQGKIRGPRRALVLNDCPLLIEVEWHPCFHKENRQVTRKWLPRLLTDHSIRAQMTCYVCVTSILIPHLWGIQARLGQLVIKLLNEHIFFLSFFFQNGFLLSK